MAECELTCMCMIFDRASNRVLVQNRKKSWKGMSFPGGHVEDGESLVDTTIREVKEETGLIVSDLKACGIIHSFNDKTKERFFVFNFKTEMYSGELIEETDEGKVFWVDVNELPRLELAEGFRDRLPMFFEEKYVEGFCTWNDESEDYIVKLV